MVVLTAKHIWEWHAKAGLHRGRFEETRANSSNAAHQLFDKWTWSTLRRGSSWPYLGWAIQYDGTETAGMLQEAGEVAWSLPVIFSRSLK